MATYLAFVGDAAACSIPIDWTPKLGFTQATYVFVATIESAEFQPVAPDPSEDEEQSEEVGAISRDFGIVSAHYSLIETIKGSPPSIGTVTSSNFFWGACGSFPVLTGAKYLLYVEDFTPDSEWTGVWAKYVRDSEGSISALSTTILDSSAESDAALAEARDFAKSAR